MMNINYKLKTRQTKQESSSRRIRTEANENTKKISFYLNKPTRQPLNQNKRILNQTEQHSLYSQFKRQKAIKSINSKNAPVSSKLTTEPYEKNHIISLGQKHAIDRIFMTGKNQNTKPSQHSKKITVKQRQKKEQKDVKIHSHHKAQSQLRQPKLQGQARYSYQDKVGAGTFGVVHKARDKKTLEIVAIKKVFQDKKYKNRELQILQLLNHPNTLKIRDCFYTYQGDKEYLNVVMDYFSYNLYQVIQKYRHKTQMPRLKLKVLAFQMFRSLLYLSKLKIAHRDIKPQNILVNDNNWKLIMCDFGSAKQLKQGEPNISYICSRCYRAPELIFGNASYTTQIDMWSAGCVLAQMITMQPVFRAESNIDQLVQIIKILGTPSHSQMLEMNPECDFQKYRLPKISGKSWEKVMKRKNLGFQFYDLLRKVLCYSPLKRLSPYQALLHPFFDEIRQEQTYLKLKKQIKIPDIFDFFTTQEVNLDKIRKLTPSWMNKL